MLTIKNADGIKLDGEYKTFNDALAMCRIGHAETLDVDSTDGTVWLGQQLLYTIEGIAFEAGLCPVGTGPATKIAGPFETLDALGTFLDAQSTFGTGMAWLWGIEGTIERSPDCVQV